MLIRIHFCACTRSGIRVVFPSRSSQTTIVGGALVTTDYQPYHVPGFRWVRRFALTILVLFALMISGVLSLVMMAEMDVAVTSRGVVEPTHRRHIKPAIDGTIKAVLVR